ncbi:hypothetical protein N0V85_006255 [Neurospora sp. IMI 360204]|nr:hypothetical protein N0V85_006255 [Neurospora sp. IMI 360204]
MDPQAINNPPAEDLYDGAPADWVALVQTLPLCDQCGERPAHLPGASRCLGCLGNRPGPNRRRQMWRIIREAKLLRKLNVLLVPATRKMQMAHEAAESARNADTPLAAVQHAIKALATVVNVRKLLERAGNILRELTQVDVAKGDAARPNFLGALHRYRQVAPLVQDAFVFAATALAAQNDNNRGLMMEALSNIDNFMPQLPPQQHGEHQNQQGSIAHPHHGDHQHHAEDPLGENNNNVIPPEFPQKSQGAIAHPHHGDHQHHAEDPVADNDNLIAHEAPQQPDGHEHQVREENLSQAVPQQPNDNQQDDIEEYPYDMLFIHDYFLNQKYNPLPLVAPQEEEDDDDPYPDNILLAIDRFLNQAYNPVPQTDN